MTRTEQLRGLDTRDWQRLGLPALVEEAVRKALEVTNQQEDQSGRESPTHLTSMKCGPEIERSLFASLFNSGLLCLWFFC